MAIDSPPSLSVITTGFRDTPSVESIATWGWLMTGATMKVPKGPEFETVNVPPMSSSVRSFELRARAARSAISRAIAPRRLSSARRTTGASSPSKLRSMATLRSTWSCSTSPPSTTEALRCGNSCSTWTSARQMNGKYVKVKPSARRHWTWFLCRTDSIRS